MKERLKSASTAMELQGIMPSLVAETSPRHYAVVCVAGM